ncbi:TPA: autotransporter outer membrane beta-barrel domain-containing protein [Yersinia enterocolitica]|nr:autotransporter outer membrane beta-barrel domain-containing protein [Yersinia enterocolitica]
MENINNLRKYILKTSIPKQVKLTLRKTPIAKFVASVLFILGSTSTNVNADTAPTHVGAVNNENVTLTSNQKASNSNINGSNSLILTDNAEALNTIIDTDHITSYFLLGGKSRANTTQVRKGRMEITDNASASNTFLGLFDNLAKEENELVPETPGTMEIYKNGKTIDTTIGIYGKSYLGGSGTMENTYIQKGGELVVKSIEILYPTLSDTTVEGILDLDSDVKLNGKTEFLPGSELKTHGHDITNDGDIIFSGISGGIVANIDGSGSLTIDSPEKIFTLQGKESNQYMYSGLTHIKAGTLKLSEANFSYSPIIAEAGTDLVLFNSILDTNVNGGRMIIDGQSIWHMPGVSNVDGLNISESGQLNLNSKLFGDYQAGNKLIINGDYHSNGGTLTFYSVLEGDDSETDSMLVEGNTSGHTKVKINNLGGKGALTNLGILLIEVRGLSDGDFKQVGRNVAGIFEYFLVRGESEQKKNWYMVSDAPKENKTETTPELPKLEENKKEATPELLDSEENNSSVNSSDSQYHQVENVSYKHDLPGPGNNPVSALFASLPEKVPEKIKEEVAESTDPVPQEKDLKDKSDNTPAVKGSEEQANPPTEVIAAAAPPNKAKVVNENIPPKTYQPVYRPENGSYIANLSMARNLFTSDLDSRSANYKYKDAATGEWRTSSMWMQTQGGIKQFGKTVDQLNIKGKYYSVQLGGDVAQWDIGTQGSGRIGMLAGMGKATNHSKSNITGYYSNGSVNGYNLGVYATWLTDQQNNAGFYIDTLAQYSWFNNAVNGQELAEEKYKSSGFTSSIESGYTFNIGSTEQLSYFIQPNAKITWVGINAQTHTAANKDIINYTNRGQLITRIGAKTYLQTTNNSEQQFMPFIAINWLHQNHNTGTQLSGQGVENGSKNSAEFKIGVESKIDQRLHAWANINHQIGNYNTSDTNALVGIKYAF